MAELDKAIEELLGEGRTPIQARSQLIQQGFLEEEVDRALNTQSSRKVSSAEKKTNRQLSTKEVLDRVGYGFASPQFVNILFYLSGAGLFMIGVFNGLKTILSLLFSSALQEYDTHNTVSKSAIANSSLIFGFSFFAMALAVIRGWPWVFAVAFVIGSVGVVIYGDLYMRLVKAMMKHERMSAFLRKAAFFGIVISTISLVLSGLLIDKVSGDVVLMGMTFHANGYLISFMITTFAFILGGYVMNSLPDPREQKTLAFGKFFKRHLRSVVTQGKVFVKNPYVFLLLVPATLAGLLQILGTSFYGIFIFREFNNAYFGGFLNVAVLYGVALLASLLGPFFTKFVERSTGLAPHLVFGTLLSAILPLVLVMNPHYFAVMAALICSVFGAAITGTAQGLIAQKIMDFPTRKAFFVTQAFLVAIPYAIMIPLGSWVAATFGLEALFLGIVFGLAIIVMPMYFLLVTMTNQMRL